VQQSGLGPNKNQESHGLVMTLICIKIVTFSALGNRLLFQHSLPFRL